MNNQLLIKNSNEYKQLLSSSPPLTENADSGIASRITPLSSINDNKLLINPIDDDDDDNQSITTEKQCLSFTLTDISKRMRIFFYHEIFSMIIF